MIAGSFMTTQFCVLLQDTQVPEQVWHVVASSTVFLNVLARLPQIITICREGSTGSLAFATQFLSCAGSVARLITVLIESDDLMYKIPFVTGFVLNLIIIIQFFIYWGADGEAKKVDKEGESKKSK